MERLPNRGTMLFPQEPDAPVSTGEGITFTTEPGAGFYWVEILHSGQAPLYSYVRAQSSCQAKAFCRNRHPRAMLIRLMEGE